MSETADNSRLLTHLRKVQQLVEERRTVPERDARLKVILAVQGDDRILGHRFCIESDRALLERPRRGAMPVYRNANFSGTLCSIGYINDPDFYLGGLALRFSHPEFSNVKPLDVPALASHVVHVMVDEINVCRLEGPDPTIPEPQRGSLGILGNVAAPPFCNVHSLGSQAL